MRKYLLLAGAALIGLGGSAYAALDCNTPPTCDELGYAYPSHWCENQAVLKCPFDQTKVFCGKPKDPDAPITCEVGSILFNDFKCYDKAPTDLSEVLGVVFDPVKRLANVTQEIEREIEEVESELQAEVDGSKPAAGSADERKENGGADVPTNGKAR